MRIANIIFIFLLAFIFIKQIYPAEVGWTRYYLESDRTRIVFFLDEIPKYETNYDEENNTLNITLLDAHLGKPSKKFSVNSAFISSISLKQTDNDTVDIQISLPKPAIYNVFDIKSPALIIVDVSSTEKAIKSETLAVSPKEQKTEFNKINENKQVNNTIEVDASTKISKAEDKSNDDNSDTIQSKSDKLSIMNLQWQALESLNGNIMTILQYIFDLLVLFLVIHVIIKIRSVDKITRYIRQNRRKLKDNPAFANILDEIEKGNNYNLQKIRSRRLDGGKEKETKETKLEDGKNANDEGKIKQYDKVHELAKKGIDPISISEKSNIPVGEVNLILDLIRTRKGS